MTGYMAKFLSFFFAFCWFLLKSFIFFLLGYATRLLRLLGRYATSRIEARFDRSLLRTYERSTCSNPSIVFTDTKSGPMKKRTTPLAHLPWCAPPKFCISIIFNFCCDGCNIQEKWKITWNLRLCKILGGGGGGGQIRCIMGVVQVPNLSWPNKVGQERIYFMAKLSWFWFTTVVLMLFSILRAGRPPRH